MKNKKLKYILVPLVLIIWGLIFYKIFKQANEDNVTMGTDPIKHVIIKDSIRGNDYQLDLSYRDPFKIGESSDNKEILKSINKANKPKVTIVWPSIQVSGYVLDKKNKPKFWVLIDNVNYIMQQGDIINNVRFSFIKKDSIVFTFANENKSIAVKF